MYSAKIEGKPTTFGTSGMLYRSNKVMYDRATKSLWHQFTGEPIIGPLANSGIVLPFFPSVVTTWAEWLEEHPDTTVISTETGLYAPSFYVPETDSRAIYFEYFNSPETMFPVPHRKDGLEPKDIVAGLSIGGAHKAYPVTSLQRERVVNDTVGGQEVVIVASASTRSGRAYHRNGLQFSGVEDGGAPAAELRDGDGALWQVTEKHLIMRDDPTQTLARIPTSTSFWFGWFSFHQDTLLFDADME